MRFLFDTLLQKRQMTWKWRCNFRRCPVSTWCCCVRATPKLLLVLALRLFMLTRLWKRNFLCPKRLHLRQGACGWLIVTRNPKGKGWPNQVNTHVFLNLSSVMISRKETKSNNQACHFNLKITTLELLFLNDLNKYGRATGGACCSSGRLGIDTTASRRSL